MIDTPLYQTTRSAEVKRKLLLNGLGAVMLTVLSGWLWWTGGHWLQVVIFVIMAPLAVLLVVTFFRSKHPLQIFEDRIVLSSSLRTTIPLSNVEGIGTDPKRGEPSLTYVDEAKEHRGEIAILWRFIREPRTEVLAQIEAALARRQA